jgi:hypothetical protein
VAVSGQNVVVGSNFDSGSPVDSTYLFRLKYNNAPLITTPILDQTVVVGTAFSFSVPLFADLDWGIDWSERLTLTATLADGTALPVWITFNPLLRTFSGTAPSLGLISIKVTATDLDIASVSDVFDTTVASTVALLRVRVVENAAEIGLLNYQGDYDGRLSLTQYAFGSTATDATAADTVSVLRIAKDLETGHLVMAFDRRTNDPRITYLLEQSADLQTWTSAADTLQEVMASAIGPNFEEALFFHAAPSGQETPGRFFRVRALFGQSR